MKSLSCQIGNSTDPEAVKTAPHLEELNMHPGTIRAKADASVGDTMIKETSTILTKDKCGKINRSHGRLDLPPPKI